MRQNPWLDVGRLAVGHVLYRLGQSPAQDYEMVEVTSIEKTAPATRIVYPLRLADGQRLHHQNGYLANINEPEIRPRDIATLLGRFFREDQVTRDRIIIRSRRERQKRASISTGTPGKCTPRR